ncbi:MAG TPA: SDR family oxidoreductase [Pseudogracilibacillus sp.]|nr:SDR family oxidoreductase [Pseudogracilibacillus sp.]
MQPKTAIVTGASSGIGKAIAEKLAAEKMNVALVARSGDTLTSIAEELTSKYDANVIAVPTDVSNQSEIEEMVQQVEDAFGFIDVYVNNAGLMLDAAVTDGSLDKWEQMIDVNIKGVLYGLHQVIPKMIAKKSGHIINISSVSGQEVTKKSTVYSATKFAVRAISMGLEKELAYTGVKVTNISPGMVDTRLINDYELKRKPLDASDIANAIYYAITQPEHVNLNEITIRPV